MTVYANASYPVKNVSTSGSTVVTVASGTLAIASLLLANTSVSPVVVSAYITRSGVNYYLVAQSTVAVGSALEAIQGNRIVLQTSDILVVTAGAANSVDAWVSGLTAV